MTYAEFLHWCLAADAQKTVPPVPDLVQQVLNRLRRPNGPSPPRSL